jgi:phenylacetate-CoA ligase
MQVKRGEKHMDWYSPVVKHVIHPLWAFKDGERHLRILRDLEQWQYSSPEKLAEHRMERLRGLVIHAYDTCPYYRDIFHAHGIEPRRIQSFDDFRKIPMLTKEDIQGYSSRMVSSMFTPEQLVSDKTGGSTGKPIHYYRDVFRRDMQKAAAIRHNRWVNLDIGDKIAVVWGHREDLAVMAKLKSRIRNVLLDRMLYLDASSMSDHDVGGFLEKLEKFRPDGYLGYANSLYQVSLFMKEKGFSAPSGARSVISSAEVLHDHERELIEEMFGVKVFDRYGCREFGPIASECEYRSGLHIAADYLYVEFLDEHDEPVEYGKQGNIVVTDLFNYGMPFIRYRIEDVGVPVSGTCGCGRMLPLMDNLAGRVTDFLITPEGVRVSGASVTIALIANVPGLSQAQFIQHEHDSMKMKIVRSDEFNEDSLRFLENELPKYFGHTMKIDLEYVESIPKEKSGKFRFSICTLKERDRAIGKA